MCVCGVKLCAIITCVCLFMPYTVRMRKPNINWSKRDWSDCVTSSCDYSFIRVSHFGSLPSAYIRISFKTVQITYNKNKQTNKKVCYSLP